MLMQNHFKCLCTDCCSVLAIVGKTKQNLRHHKVYHTRNTTAEQHVKINYEQLRITEEDMTRFAACKTRAAEVCMLL